MRSEGYGTRFVSVSVCLSVTTTTRNETMKQRYQLVLRYTGFIFKKGNFGITTVFKSYCVKSKWTSQYAGLPRPRPLALCILKAREVAMKGIYATNKGIKSPAFQLVVPHMRSSPRVCTLVLFVLLSIEINLTNGVFFAYMQYSTSLL